tara:strand:+ start:88 stop:585 length:498 start_codon:yes stop_codon:yes gene_type:complete
MSAAEIHVNSDGLEVRYGSEKATKRKGGETNLAGDSHELRVVITAIDVPTADAPIDKKIAIPSGAFIESATIVVKTAFTSGGSATLDLGLMTDDNDGTYSTKDDDGIDAAIGKATLTADAVVTCNGALIGTTVSDSNSLPIPLSYGFGTAVFTAGEADLVVRYKL